MIGPQALPPAYAWLADEPAPKMLVEAVKEYGVHEGPGGADNPRILAWAKEIGVHGYDHDSIPWCSLFMSLCAKRAGKPLTNSPLWALSWKTWGNPVPVSPELGDVLVFIRPGGGHVGLYVGDDNAAYHVLGGNESDQVMIERIAKSRCVAARRLYSVAVPATVRRVRLGVTGAPLSQNEA